MSTSVAVIGGGISGLAAAWELTTALPEGARIVLFEADAQFGGKLQTGELGGRPVDLGPDAFVARREEAVALCDELGLGDQLVAPGTSRAYVWARGRLRALPQGLALGVPTLLGPLAASGICSPLGVSRAALDLLGPRGRPPRSTTASSARGPSEPLPDATVGALVRRRLGGEVHDRLADPLVGGIHAGPVNAMSAAAVFPQLLEAAARPGSLMRALRRGADGERPAGRGADKGLPRAGMPVFFGLKGGMKQLVDRLSEALEGRGVELRLRTQVERLEPRRASGGSPVGWSVSTASETMTADGVVTALPGPAAAGLLAGTDAALADSLRGVPYASVSLASFRFPAGAVLRRLDGSGFLVPACEGRLLTACTWLSSKWPELGRQNDVLLRASMGRFGDDRAAHMSDEEIVRRALRELDEMVGVHGEPLEALVTRWETAFPQYLVGHLRRVAEIEERARHLPPLVLAGAALHGVGIPACIGSGRRAARTLRERLGTGSRHGRGASRNETGPPRATASEQRGPTAGG